MSVLSTTMRMGASQPSTTSDPGEAGTGKSLRFTPGDTTYLNKTPSTVGNRRIWTWAGWVKRSNLGSLQMLFTSHVSGNDYVQLFFNSDDTLRLDNNNSWKLFSNAVYRDVSAWMHIVCAVNTTLSIADDRIKLFVNGKQLTSFGTRANPSANSEGAINKTLQHSIGSEHPAYTRHFDGYLTDVHFTDGLALSPAAFGSFDSNGVFNPAAFALPAPNDGTTWSSGGTTVGNWNEPNYGVGEFFDGNVTSTPGGACSDSNAWNGARYTLPSTVTVKSQVRVFTNATDDRWGYDIGNGFERAANLPAPIGSSAPYIWTLPITTEFKGIACSDAQQIFGIEVDGVVLMDGTTNASARANPNNDTDWSGNITVSGSSSDAEFAKIVDGSLATNVYCSAGNATATGTFSPKVTYNTQMRVYGKDHNGPSNTYKLYINGTMITQDGDLGWTDITSAVSSAGGLETVKVGDGNGNWSTIYAIEVDGHILVDNTEDNSFHLKFDNITNDAALGTDSFGNGTWTVNNLSTSTASDGLNLDSFTDHPTGSGTDGGAGGQVRGNFCTVNTLDKHADVDLEQGNLYVKREGAWKHARGTFGMSTGKWYFEAESIDDSGTPHGVLGIATAKASFTESYGGAVPQIHAAYVNATSTGGMGMDGSWTGNVNFTAGNYIGVAVDMDAKTVRFYRNGVIDSAATTIDQDGPYFPWIGPHSTGWIMNFGQRTFKHAAPAGYKTLCSINLSDLFGANDNSAGDKNKPSKYFDVRTYNGTGEATRNLIYPFSPDFIWIKSRSNGGWQHVLYDKVRGAGSGSTTTSLSTNDTRTAASGNDTNHGHLSAFNSDGVTLTKGSQGGGDYVNHDGWTYAAWAWDAGSSAAGANNDGSINVASGDQWVNTLSKFSVTKFTGTGSLATVGHGLDAKPDMIIIKNYEDGGGYWFVYHSALGATKLMELNSSAAEQDHDHWWNDTEPTDDVFTVNVKNDNNGSGDNLIAYSWAAVPGYSAFGSYTGNGNTNGPFINTGFTPKYCLVKKTSAAEGWNVMDTERDAINPVGVRLVPNGTGAEDTNASHDWDFLSNGFKIRSSDGWTNGDGASYMYAAFAEHPFKTARAR